jgi:hypothetical protein
VSLAPQREHLSRARISDRQAVPHDLVTSNPSSVRAVRNSRTRSSAHSLSGQDRQRFGHAL